MLVYQRVKPLCNCHLSLGIGTFAITIEHNFWLVLDCRILSPTYSLFTCSAWEIHGKSANDISQTDSLIDFQVATKYWNLYGYGSIPINTIFRGMNIHLPAILMFTRGTRFWHTAIYLCVGQPWRPRMARSDIEKTGGSQHRRQGDHHRSPFGSRKENFAEPMGKRNVNNKQSLKKP